MHESLGWVSLCATAPQAVMSHKDTPAGAEAVHPTKPPRNHSQRVLANFTSLHFSDTSLHFTSLLLTAQSYGLLTERTARRLKVGSATPGLVGLHAARLNIKNGTLYERSKNTFTILPILVRHDHPVPDLASRKEYWDAPAIIQTLIDNCHDS
jgi:hypothetical protein